MVCNCSPGKKWRRLGRERTAGGVLKLAIVGMLPVLIVQVVLAWFSKIFQSKGVFFDLHICAIDVLLLAAQLLRE